MTEVQKNPGARKGWLVLDGNAIVGWRRLKKEATALAAEYDDDPDAYKARQIEAGLTFSCNETGHSVPFSDESKS